MTSGDLAFDLTYKINEVVSSLLFILPSVVYRMPLRGPGAELEGAINSPPSHQVVENLEAQQSAG